MPELPEVETIVRQLDRVLPSKVIAKVDVLREKSFQGNFLRLIGEQIKQVSRKQKMIVIKLSGDMVLLVHLKMTGQFIFQPKVEKEEGRKKKEERIEQRIVGGHPTSDWVREMPGKHTRVIIYFTDGSTLYFNDQRVFGWIKLVPITSWLVLRDKLAPDVVDEAFSSAYLASVLKKSGRPVKVVIMDQAKIGGMGNIYACDALFIAKIHPNMPANQVKMNAVKKLHLAMKRVISRGITVGGASYSDYVGIDGLGGRYQDEFLVYGRAGEVCKICATPILKMKLAGRGTYWCPGCQVE